MREFFYRPSGAWAADFIPYFEGGKFRLFYLLDWRDKANHGEGTPWYLVSTKDFVQFTEHGEVLGRGSVKDQDLYVFTGSVIRADDQYHIFYTGHNPHVQETGKPDQGVMHAVSDDLVLWKKLPNDTMYAPKDRFEPDDWRDPFVFWNRDAHEYWMLLAARLKVSGPSRRKGCTALCASADLKSWEVRDPLYSPNLYYTHECPDLFQMGKWWYLIFSEFSDLVRTRYRMAKSPSGPWRTPDDDTFDGRAFYAAKTASDGAHRYLFGWNSTRSGNKDYQGWEWGGNLVVHEIKQQKKNGALTVSVPATVDRAWKRTKLAANFDLTFGNVNKAGRKIEISAIGTFACSAAGHMPARCRIESLIKFERGTHSFGLMLRTSDDLEKSYYVRLEPPNKRLVFDSWPWSTDHPITNTAAGCMPGLERKIDLKPDTEVDLVVFVDGSICIAYVNGMIALSCRMYNYPSGRWGFFVEQGIARFSNNKISTI
jgi:beta-fructofuranosidase